MSCAADILTPFHVNFRIEGIKYNRIWPLALGQDRIETLQAFKFSRNFSEKIFLNFE